MQAYVTQDDNLIGTLTVRETISYSARLRLPDKMAWSEKQALIESTIIEMGLQDCADTVIGNWHLRGISGGEKRRVSIAIEILMRPRLLFLDEPTSGLDRLFHIFPFVIIFILVTYSNKSLFYIFCVVWEMQCVCILRNRDIARTIKRRKNCHCLHSSAEQ